ncbi:MAG: glycosyltransferase [Hahellaceae bacterium]|nr:glycosyltransferase [Hahellaceae bacterium]
MSGKALFVAYHYPPIAVSSGVHRTLAFTRYLADWGWQVTVLTAKHTLYPRYDLSQNKSIPEQVNVIRAWGKDTARDLSIGGKYLQFMAIPDRYQSWILGGVLSGLKSIRLNRPNVIISTYPIASAHVIAFLLHKLTGIPWVADFRDPMAQEDYPSNPSVKRSFFWIERQAVKYASKLIFVTESAKNYYLERYQDCDTKKFCVIENGYDEAVFSRVELLRLGTEVKATSDNLSLNFLHSGVIYPSERDPRFLFRALQELKQEGGMEGVAIRFTLRATGHDDLFEKYIREYGLENLISLEAPIPYEAAISEMFDTDVLLLLQANNCDNQVPAKAYEYIRVGKPVLALTSKSGETGRLISEIPNSKVAPLDDVIEIKNALRTLIDEKKNGVLSSAPAVENKSYSRENGAKRLAEILSVFS